MMTNLIITALGVGSVLFLMKSDVRHGSAMLRRNVKTIRAWLEDEGASAAARSGPSVTHIESSTRREDKEGPKAH